ncbi:hypothetical protein BUALT_Bualt12G0075800 [Buddleja alternifolia]|uniref:50S ribosomal protein L35 n=1 Tax=Buddleja alternifolia TaxID=168488 RepID=A0AAV6WPM4_9LAMI|nr:hypothetical protein BUALT_Bualt12G0075800 [Buddleja alternifolia]
MSLAEVYHVNSSSSDDFAAFLEVELDDGDECDYEFDLTRVKRRKLEPDEPTQTLVLVEDNLVNEHHTVNGSNNNNGYNSVLFGIQNGHSTPNNSTTNGSLHAASAKRFRVTGTGKIVRRRAGKQHLLRKKNTKRRNRLSKMV